VTGADRTLKAPPGTEGKYDDRISNQPDRHSDRLIEPAMMSAMDPKAAGRTIEKQTFGID
jgi:hypothetical protein